VCWDWFGEVEPDTPEMSAMEGLDMAKCLPGFFGELHKPLTSGICGYFAKVGSVLLL